MNVVNFGSLNIDHVYAVDHFCRAGETIHTKSYTQNAGGKGLNQSIAVSRSGQKVHHAGLLGPERLYEGSQGVTIFSGRGDVQINAVIAAVGQCFGNCRGCGGGALQNAGLTGNTQQDRLAGGGCCFHDLFLRIADTQSQPGVLTAGQRSRRE